MKVVNFNNITLDRKDIIERLSKSRRTKKHPSEKLNKQIDEMLYLADNLMNPTGVYNIFEKKDLPDKPYFEQALQIGFAICTIGEDLPKQTQNFLQNGELVKGVILDAIGSVAADTVADYVNDLIKTDAEGLKLVPSMRYSPGYCDAPLSDQTLIFDKLGAESDNDIGVQLTSQFMMKPIKSVSFAINLGLSFINRCKTCSKENCPHRR
ncbi:MAG: hypothetical protein GPJ54_04915 [Candidatus Heimdallarchaeota archaeon]|nr:hypothetical protein [Candidatus Heimdallarchaeota archaeon]